MLDERKRTFLGEGAVTIPMGRRRATFLLAVGVLFLIGGAFLLAVPAALTPRGVVRLLAACAALAMGLLGIVLGARSMVRPMVVVRLARDGIHVPVHALIPWQEVEGVGTATVAGQEMVVVHAAEGHGATAGDRGGWRGRLTRANAALLGPGVVALRPGADGGDGELRTLIAWAHEEMTGGAGGGPPQALR